MRKMTPRLQKRMEIGALNYARAEHSDPFAYARAALHIRNGIAGERINAAHEYEDAFYDAVPRQEKRMTVLGVEYYVTRYYNMRRP